MDLSGALRSESIRLAKWDFPPLPPSLVQEPLFRIAPPQDSALGFSFFFLLSYIEFNHKRLVGEFKSETKSQSLFPF